MSLPIYEILFETWKNKCDRCLSQPTPENIRDLCQFLESAECSPEFLEPLSSYCLYPFRILIERLPIVAENPPIQKFSVETFLLEIFRTLCVIFKKIQFTKKELFEEFLTILSFFIDEDVDAKQSDSLFNYPPKIIKISNELYLRLFDCLNCLLRSCNQYKLWFRTSNELKFKLGYLINASLKQVQCPNNSPAVKLKALNSISIIISRLIPGRFQKRLNPKLKPDDFSEEINFVAFTLPRIVSIISKVFVLYPDLSSNNLSRNGLKLFSQILTIVFNWCQTFPKNSSKQTDPNDHSKNMTVQFNQDWFDETCRRLTPIFKNNIVRCFLRNDNNRDSLLQFCQELFDFCCNKFILKFIKILIKIPLIFYSSNDGDKTNFFQLFCFESPNRIDDGDIDFTKLTNLVQESFFEHIKALPYLVRNIDYSSMISNDQISSGQILTEADSRLALRVFGNFVSAFGQSKSPSLYEFIKLEQHNFHLFRTLVNLAEFDFKPTLPLNLSEFENFDSKFRTSFDASENDDPNPNSNKPLSSQHLWDSFSLESHLRYLQDRSLCGQYCHVVRLLSKYSSNGADILMIDHLTQILEQSQFEPSVVLVMNLLLEGFIDQTSCLDSVYRSSLIDLYLKHLNNCTQLYAMEDLVDSNNKRSNKQLESIRLENLRTICSSSNETVINHRTNTSQICTISKSNSNSSLHRQILKHCLILHGLTMLCARNDPNTRNEFYRKCFCLFLESFASNYRFISTIAENSLIFIKQQYSSFEPDSMKYVNRNHLFYIYQMINDNFTYLYSSFTIALDYSVLHQNQHGESRDNQSTIDSSNDQQYQIESILYQYSTDHSYSLKTIQLSLLAIFRLFRHFYGHSSKDQKSQIFHYFNKLVDQILKIIKYYSICRPDTSENCAGNLNRLLLVLHSYLELLTVAYGGDDYQLNSGPNLNKRIADTSIDTSVDDMIQNLEQYIDSLQSINDEQIESNSFDDKDIGHFDGNKIPPDISEDPEDPDLEKNIKILSSPIINSRASQVLYYCSLILSDSNIDIRLNVLKLISMSMRLLRTYEDVLLPYVHKLWDPLVNRFSSDYDHPLIFQCAFRCLLLASEFCGDFLLARFRKDILPRLVSFLDSQLEFRRTQPIHQTRSTVKTIEYYAESELLRSIGQLVVNLKLDSVDLWKIIPSLMLYLCLHNVQPEQQRYAFESLVTISSQLDSSSIYYYLHRIVKLYYPNSSIDRRLPALNNSKYSCNCSVQQSKQTNLHKLSNYFQQIEKTLLNDLLSHLDSV